MVDSVVCDKMRISVVWRDEPLRLKRVRPIVRLVTLMSCAVDVHRKFHIAQEKTTRNKKTPPFTLKRNSGAGTEKRPNLTNKNKNMRPDKVTVAMTSLTTVLKAFLQFVLDHTNFNSNVYSRVTDFSKIARSFSNVTETEI